MAIHAANFRELRLERLSREFGTVNALKDVSLTIQKGEFIALLGPSGCGKSTTLNLIAGLLPATGGSIWLDERRIDSLRPEERGFGMVFQNYALFPHMTVAENVAYGLRFRDPPGGVSTDERVADLLELVDLEGFEERDPDELSGGQRQRVALARALAPGPEVLLLDEPMSALDARLRQSLRTQVKAIQSELAITTVYVTHDQEEALAVSDRVAVMNDGRVEQVGRPEAVYRRPKTRFVAAFVGDNNVFDGEVRDGRAIVDGTAFRVADLDAAEGERVTFCVRPENLERGGGENAFEATVETVEFLGESFRVRLDWNGRTVVLRVPERPEDDRIRVGFDPADASLVGGTAKRDVRGVR